MRQTSILACYLLTPKDVEEVSQPYIERALALTRRALGAASLQSSAIARVLLVGGAMLNPRVRSALAAELPTRIDISVDPTTVVARGAAVFAGTQPLRDAGSTLTL